LEADVQAYLAELATARGIPVTQLVNELLKKDIELIETALRKRLNCGHFASSREAAHQ